MLWDSIAGPILQAVTTVIDRLVPDHNAAQRLKDELAAELQRAAIASDAAQLAIDKEESGSSSLFVAGARPGFMWLCILVLGWTWFLAPLLTWGLVAIGAHTVPALPTLGADQAQTALYGMLGLGAYRSVDKIFAPASTATKTIRTML